MKKRKSSIIVENHTKKRKEVQEQEEVIEFPFDSVKVGNRISIQSGNSYYKLNNRIEPTSIQNVEFRNSIILSIIYSGDNKENNAFVIDSRKNVLLLWFTLRDSIIQSINDLLLHYRVIDIDDDGDRWEGQVEESSGEILGYGTLYDSKDGISYRGFRFGNMNFGYGMFFYPEINVVMYEGLVSGNEYCGKGKLFDKNGKLVHKSIFIGQSSNLSKVNLPIKKKQCFSNCCKEIIFSSSYRLPKMSVDFSSHLPQLQAFVCSASSLTYLPDLVFENHHNIRAIILRDSYFAMKDIHRDYNFIVRGCTQLKEVMVENESLASYKVCDIEDCPSLLSVSLGDRNFSRMFSESRCCIRNCAQLESITIGDDCFQNCKEFIIENLRSLSNCSVGINALDEKSCLRLTSILTLRNLPMLTALSFLNSFQEVGKVVFENVPALTKNKHSFKYVYEMKATNASGLEKAVRHNSRFFSMNKHLCLSSLSSTIRSFVSESIYHNEVECIDFGQYPNLEEIVISPYSFPICKQVLISGLKKLKNVKFSRFCFNYIYEISNAENLDNMEYGNDNVNGHNSYSDDGYDYSEDQEVDEYDSDALDRLDERGMDEYDSDALDRLDEQGMDAYDSEEEDISVSNDEDLLMSDNSGENEEVTSNSDDQLLEDEVMSEEEPQDIFMKKDLQIASQNLMKVEDNFNKPNMHYDYIHKRKMRTRGSSLVIENCPLLEELVIEDYCFSEFEHAQIQNCPCIKKLVMGADSFFYVSTFILKDMKSLKFFDAKSGACTWVRKLVLEDIPQLESVVFNMYAFRGDIFDPEKNELVWKNMPKLHEMTLINSIHLFGIATIQHVGTRGFSIRTPNFPFSHIHTYTCDNERVENYITNNQIYKEQESSYQQQQLVLTSHSYNISDSIQQQVEIIEIGSFSGRNINAFVLSGYPKLKNLLVGTMGLTCFGQRTKLILERFTESVYPFEISHCPLLTVIRLGGASCGNFNTVTIANCDSLVEFDCTPLVFDTTFTFTISNCNQLRKLRLESHMGSRMRTIRIENMARLESILICKFFNFENEQLVMKNLPKLRLFKGVEDAFATLYSLIVEDIPNLSPDHISISIPQLSNLTQLSIRNCKGIAQYMKKYDHLI